MVRPLDHFDEAAVHLYKQLLIDAGIGSDPTDNTTWPVFLANMPDSPDNAIAVFETDGVLQGRLMPNGIYAKKLGWNIIVRSGKYSVGDSKATALRVQMTNNDVGNSYPLVIQTLKGGSFYYQVNNVQLSSGPIPLGKEEGNISRRYLWSLNFYVSAEYLEGYSP